MTDENPAAPSAEPTQEPVGTPETAPPAVETPPPPAYAQGAPVHYAPLQPPAPQKPQKSPLLAAILGFFPGLGHIYCGLYARGLVVFAVFAALITAGVETDGNVPPLLPLSVAFVLFFNVFDAFRQASMINLGLTEEDMETVHRRASGGVVAGVALVLIGLYGFLEKYVPAFDPSVIFDHWFLLIMAFGGWLIFSAWRDRRQEEADDL